MNIKSNLSVLALGGMLLTLSACSKDDDVRSVQPDINEDYQYVIAASSGENSYLLQTSSIDEGSISAKGGIQVMGDRSWYFFKDFAAYSFIYSQGDPGKTSSFVLDGAGVLKSRRELGLEKSLQTRGVYNDYIIGAFSSRSYTDPVATFYKINTATEAVSDEIPVNTKNITGNGEQGYFTDLTQYGDYILAGVRTIKAAAGGSVWTDTDFADSTFVVVLDEDLKIQSIIRDGGRTGQVVGQAKSNGETGIEVVDNGDVYVFSSASNSATAPSGVLKINQGELEFDDNYFFNISEASGGHKLWRVYYVGGSQFVLQMYSSPGKAGVDAGVITKFAVVDVASKNFAWVTAGVPADILEIGTPLIDREKGRVVFPINTSGARPSLYILNASSKTMTKGMEVEAEGIKGIGKLRKN